MIQLPSRAKSLFVLLAFLIPTLALAESSSRLGQYTVHYNAIKTATLMPQIAAQYDITRSNKRGLLNVTIRRDAGNKPAGDAAEAESVTATWTNRAGQMGQINMREIREQNAIYYIGEFPIRSTDTLEFHVTVALPAMNKHTFSLRRSFVVD